MARKAVSVAVVAAMLVVLAAGVAVADRTVQALIQCQTIPCFANNDSNIVYERIGNGKADDIRLRGGNDIVRANRYGNDTDRVSGGPGYDRINVRDGDTRDFVSAGDSYGGNWCIVDSRSEAGANCTKITFGRDD